MLKLDLSSPNDLSKLFESAKTYRESNFDKLWEKCIIQDEADSNEGIKIIDGSDSAYKDLPISVAIEIPHVKVSNRRKSATLAAFEMVPFVSTDVIDVPDYIEARDRILRWGFRQSKIEEVKSMCIRDMTAFSIGVAFFDWVVDRRRNLKYPRATYKDPRNVYFDPLSRQFDPNIDCRFIFECIEISKEEAEIRYPNHKFPEVDNQTIVGKPNPVKIIRSEWKDESGNVLSALFDDASKSWIEPPVEIKTGLFSYARMSLAPKRGHAYAEPDTILEQTLSNVSNLLMTISVDHQLRFSSPPILEDARDIELKNSLDAGGGFKAGKRIRYNGAIGRPSFLEIPTNSSSLLMAGYLEDKAEGIASTPDASRGIAPGSVKTGKGVIALQNAAAVPLYVYAEAVVRFGEQAAAIISKMCQLYLVDYKMLMSNGNSSKDVVPINMTSDMLEFDKYRDNPSVPTSVSARVPEILEGRKTGQMIPMTEDEAVEYATSNGVGTNEIVTIINDMALGELEVGIKLRKKLTDQERAINAQNLFAIGAASRLYVLKESGVENAEDVLRDVDKDNAQMKAGEIMLNNPLLMELATNPQAMTALGYMFEKHAASQQKTPPKGEK